VLLLAMTACHRSDAKKDIARGEVLFRQRCATCHGTGASGAQGPGLGGVVGHKAASNPRFAYSAALRASGLEWSDPTLNRFLTSPSTVVPGTLMPIPTPDANERRALIAYLGTLRAVDTSASSADASGAVRSGASAFGNYHADAPGVRRRITVADLPAPYATPDSDNGPDVVDRAPDAKPSVPPGFTIDLYADGLSNPRAIRAAPNGDLFVAESAGGKIRVLRAKDGARRAEQVIVFATGLDHPFGIAFYPPGPSPQWIYVANTNSVVRFKYTPGDLHAQAPPETVIPKLTDSKGGHWTRDVAFSPDGSRLFVSIGSASNVAEDMPKTPPSSIESWEASHGLGASWGEEEHRADVLSFTPDGKNEEPFANGIRNCVGVAVEPHTGDLWCATNERDDLGDDLVPDYVTRVRRGAFYGWPWFYMGDHEDPRLPGARPDLRGKATVPDVLLQAHSAALQIAFYGASLFPAEYQGDAFVALHGSWNRGVRTGPKIVRVPLHDGVPTGEYEDFATGFVADDSHVWGRPVGVVVAHDGALIFTEDAGGTVWRVGR
jgi:hypothetical protein